MTLYYFGCVNQPGHHFFDEDLKKLPSDYLTKNPWGRKIDGTICDTMAAEGTAQLHYHDGWTAISFPDRSVENRYGSHSTFITDSILGFDEMLALAQKTFPTIFSRYPFKITQQPRLP